MNLFVLRQANLAALSVFLLLLQLSVQSVDVANSTVSVPPDPTTSAASLAPSRQYPILTSCREYINAQWSAFETELEQHEELFASRDLYLIVLLQSLLQSRLAVPEPYRSLAPLTSFLSSYGLLPRLVDLDDVTALLEDYSAAFSRFLADPATHFNRLWVPIPVEARPLFRHLKPTKDTTRMFGDVIDQLVAAYIRHASGVGESEKDIDRQWESIQRKAEILVTVVPRYYLVLRYLTSIHGGTISLAFHLDRRGQFFRQHKHQGGVQPKPLLGQSLLGAQFTDKPALDVSNSRRKHLKPQVLIAVPGDEDFPDDIVKAILAESDEDDDAGKKDRWQFRVEGAIKCVALGVLFLAILATVIHFIYQRCTRLPKALPLSNCPMAE